MRATSRLAARAGLLRRAAPAVSASFTRAAVAHPMLVSTASSSMRWCSGTSASAGAAAEQPQFPPKVQAEVDKAWSLIDEATEKRKVGDSAGALEKAKAADVIFTTLVDSDAAVTAVPLRVSHTVAACLAETGDYIGSMAKAATAIEKYEKLVKQMEAAKSTATTESKPTEQENAEQPTKTFGGLTMGESKGFVSPTPTAASEAAPAPTGTNPDKAAAAFNVGPEGIHAVNLHMLLTDLYRTNISGSQDAPSMALYHAERSFLFLTVLAQADPDLAAHAAIARSTVGVVHDEAGRHSSALPFHGEASRQLQILRPESPEVVSVLGRLASCLSALQQFDTAAARYDDALVLARKTFPRIHPKTAELAFNAGVLLCGCQKYTQAIKLLEEALPCYQMLARGRDSLEVATCLNTIGVAMNAVGRCVEAVAMLEEAVKMTKRMGLGEEHPLTTTAAQSLAVAERKKAELEAKQKADGETKSE